MREKGSLSSPSFFNFHHALRNFECKYLYFSVQVMNANIVNILFPYMPLKVVT